ncbi:MhpC Predicted hydrolases or acyltransferases (alpha/beta hydrolase superfamily) [Comamonadaceae bacterium]|jgi:sigma-B regulation protein RsbQ
MNVLKRNNVHVTGEGDKVLLYAHGFGCNQHMWSQVVPAFAEGYRQVLFDYVGSGQSDITAFDHRRYSTLNGYAQDVLEVCDALGLTSGVTYVGHSVSSSIGMLASIARPGLFDRMVMVGPSPCFLNQPPDYIGGFERTDLEGLLALMDQNYLGWADYLTPVVSGEQGGGPVASSLSESFCSTDPVIARIFAEATFYADNRADLPHVNCPSLILQHRYDALAPVEVGEYLHQHLRNSTLQVLDVVGHCSHMSHSHLVVDAMKAYLALPA